MSFEIRFSETFRRSAKPLAKKYPSFKSDISALVAELAENPELGTPLGKNMFKVRMSITSKGKGKSAGARVISCVLYKSEQVLLADIYDKSDYASVDEDIILENLRAEGFDL